MESSTNFLQQSRDILRCQISTQHKEEERQRLNEFIVMEEERLYDAKIAFDEDCKRFNDYMDNVQLKAGEAEKERVQA